MGEIKPNEIMHIASSAGKLILENGGEIYRAEETIIHIAQSMGAREASAFVTPTVVITSYKDEFDNSYTSVVRMKDRSVNLHKIAQVNELSRRLVKRGKTSNPRQVAFLLDRIARQKTYPAWAVTLSAALSSVFFALMFGGKWRECVAAFIIGCLLRVFLLMIARFNFNAFIVSLISGIMISFSTELALLLNLIDSSTTVTIAVLMLVVPGIAIVNAIRDIIAGDLVAGNARLTEAFMIAAGLSIGTAFGVVLVPQGIMSLL